MKHLFAVIAALALAGCVHTSSNGCTEYDPWCGPKVCTTDARGCVVCTCESTQRDGQVVPDGVPDRRAPR